MGLGVHHSVTFNSLTTKIYGLLQLIIIPFFPEISPGSERSPGPN